MHEDRRCARAERHYRRLLRLLPPELRRRAGDDMVATFRGRFRRHQAAGRWARSRFWARMIADVLVTAAAERAGRPSRIRRGGVLAGLLPRGGGGGRPFPRRGVMLPSRDGLRPGIRRLLQEPLRTAALSTTLGIGIGAAVIMLALVQGVLLRPLPFAEPQRLVRMLEVDDNGGTWWPSFPNFGDWREHNDVFDGIVAVDSPRIRPVLYGDQAWRLPVGRVSRGFFTVLGVPLARGRGIAAEENAPGGAATAVVSRSFWNDRLGGRPLEELTVTVGKDRYRVVGVVDSGFRFLGNGGVWTGADVWLPLERDDDLGGRRSHGYHVIGRVRTGVDLQRARGEVNLLAARLRAAAGEPTHAHGVRLTPLQDVVVSRVRQPLRLLTWAAVLVLLVASFNLAGALLASGMGRGPELAVRRALGATRGDLAWQLLVESALLAVPGALLGIAIAWLGLRLLQLTPAEAVARVGSVSLDPGTVVTALGVALAAALVGGAAPALTLSADAYGNSLHRRGAGDVREGRAWQIFVAAQVALTMVLLSAGGLLIRSFNEARLTDLGYEPESVLAVAVSLPESRYPEAGSRRAFYERAIPALRALPGVTAVGVTNVLPHVTQQLIGGTYRPENPGNWMFAGFRTVNEGYFEALGIPRLRGGFAESDPAGGAAVVVDRSVAEGLFGSADPLGEDLGTGMLGRSLRVVGVVEAVREWDMSFDAVGTLYVDYRTQPELLLDAFLLVKTDVAATSTVAMVRRELAGVDPMVPVQTSSLEVMVGRTLADRRLVLGIALAFALVTLGLAAVGVYSIVAFATRRRRREVGIRLALGARQSGVCRTMLGHGMPPVVAGLLAGAVAAAPVGWLMRSQLVGVRPHDPIALAAAFLLLAVTATLAAYLPARAASRGDPLHALRQQ
jgi:predicted permease